MKDVFSTRDIREIDEKFKKFSANVIASEYDDNTDLLSLAINLEKYIASIFPIKNEFEEYKQQAADFAIIYEFKRNFVQRRAIRKYNKHDLREYSPNHNEMTLLQLAKQVLAWLDMEDKYAAELDEAAKYCAYKVYFDADSVAFKLPQKLDFENLVTVPSQPLSQHEHHYQSKACITSKSFDQSHYCIYCHNQKKDSCRTGLKDGSELTMNQLGNKLSGCPLKQKVSEMNYLYSKGNLIAALAVVMMDNPLVAATGDRICNDCMKSCIFQKQEPVDIPRIETQMLRDILSLPYGAEIYYLLSRWNPLIKQDYRNDSDQNIFIIGLGPAGFAMAYYMLQRGHKVTAIDGLTIDKLPENFLQPIKNWPELITNLGHYKPQGFGGVAEYGITDRWDKYNLLLIRMLLERFDNFEIKGNFRLGRDITIKDAIEKDGYDYVALCLGAGKPKVPDIKNLDVCGVYSAFTFLASLHMNKPNFTYKMPVVIVGAGLTAIDCAMAALTYNNDVIEDVTIIYRKSMQESPSYRENSHELQMGLNLGVRFLENTELESIEVDDKKNIISINKNIPVGTLIYSIGTHPNDKILEKESEAFKLYKDKIGIFGDMDPAYAGTVVKAIASVKNWLLTDTKFQN